MIAEFLLTLLIISASSFVLLLLIRQKRKKAQAWKLPPGPKRLPLIGNLHQLSGDLPHVSLQKLSNDYGPLMFLQLGSLPTLVISSADVAKDIFKTHDLIFSGRPKLFAANQFSYDNSNITFAPYGEYWREIRKIAILELLSSKRVQSFQAVRNEEVEQMLEFIARSVEPINLSRLIFLLANNIVCRVTFGKKFDSGADTGTSRFDDLMREMQALMGESSIADFFPWMEWLNKFNGRESRMKKNFRELDRLYDEEIEQHLDPRRSKPEQEDLVDVLLRIQRDSSQTIALTNEQIKSVLMVCSIPLLAYVLNLSLFESPCFHLFAIRFQV